MRITNKTLTSNYLKNLNKNLAQVQKYHNQLSSGKEVSKPSDNPMLVSKIMSLRDNIKANEQYNTNISDSIGWVKTQDTALNDVTATLNRIRDLMIYGSNGTLSPNDRLAIKDEVEMQAGQLVDILNTSFDDRYIFAGQRTKTRPFELVDIKDTEGKESKKIMYHGDTNSIPREITTGVTIDLITDASEIVGEISEEADELRSNNSLGVFLQDLIDAFENNPDLLSDDLLVEIDVHLDNVLRTRSKIGAVHNRLEAAEARNISENINLKGLLSNREDIDVAEKYMEFSVMSVVYQASLQTGASILQPSLLDYLR